MVVGEVEKIESEREIGWDGVMSGRKRWLNWTKPVKRMVAPAGLVLVLEGGRGESTLVPLPKGGEKCSAIAVRNVRGRWDREPTRHLLTNVPARKEPGCRWETGKNGEAAKPGAVVGWLSPERSPQGAHTHGASGDAGE